MGETLLLLMQGARVRSLVMELDPACCNLKKKKVLHATNTRCYQIIIFIKKKKKATTQGTGVQMIPKAVSAEGQ